MTPTPNQKAHWARISSKTRYRRLEFAKQSISRRNDRIDDLSRRLRADRARFECAERLLALAASNLRAGSTTRDAITTFLRSQP